MKRGSPSTPESPTEGLDSTPIQNPILALSGIGTGLYEEFDLEEERKSWVSEPKE